MAESIFQTYLNRLTDLSSKNWALYLPKLEGTGMIDVRDFDFLNGEPAFEVLRKLIQGKKQVPLIPEVDPRIGETNQLSKSLSKMTFRDQLIREETGAHSLYLAWLFVEGKIIGGQIVRAPILLMPIRLGVEDGGWKLFAENAWEWNPALLLAYNQAYGKEVDKELLDEMLQDASHDAVEFRIQLNKILGGNFSFQLSSALFEDQIAAFPSSQVTLDQTRFEEGRLALKTYSVLGQFAQKGSFLFREYTELILQYGDLSVEELFLKQFASDERLPVPREEQLFPVFPMDASQENALIKVRQGKSLVVEGPPGTGKSQLIANLVSDFISRGKRVLVVSQKRAALDVVYERMEKVGFGSFLALVHDFKADQRLLFDKLRTQIDAIEAYEQQNRGIDSMHLEREISRLSARINVLAIKLEELRQELFNDGPAGLPVKAMYLNAQPGMPALDSSSQLLKLDYSQALEFEAGFRVFHSYHQKFLGSFWEKRQSFALLEPGDFSRIYQTLREAESCHKSIPSRYDRRAWLRLAKSIQDSGPVSERVISLRQSLKTTVDPEKTLAAAFRPKEIEKLKQARSWLVQADQDVSALTLKLSHNASKLKNLVSELEVLIPKARSFFGNLAVRFNKSQYLCCFEALSANGLRFDFDSLSLLMHEAKTRARIQGEFEEISEATGISVGSFSNESLASLLDETTRIVNWAEEWGAVAEVVGLCDWKFGVETFDSCLSEIIDWVRNFEVSSVRWRFWLTGLQIQEVLESGISELSLEDGLFLNQTLIELSAFDRFIRDWGSQNHGLALDILRQFPQLTLDAKIAAFRNGWYLAWIGELERRSPVLAEAGSLKLDQEMEELKTSILEKRKISRHMALLRLRERVSSRLEYNRLGNRLTYRDLQHQVSKKRMRWSLRRLVAEMETEVFRLIPCWMASPETVVALFPVQKFDLVIFDEASQCKVELGLPSMLRGRQVVVAGDSKQLRPVDFYQVKWESDEDGVEYEAESVLELAGHFFEKLQLKGHYRSADPALIYFSNLHFYDRQLETLPDYQTVKEEKSPFFWEKTNGIWENQMNNTDADAVLETVKRIRNHAPLDSVGIVTGNYFQMELIREKLWRAGVQDGKIKVRNIENVQGDEFDQVILSLGYGPNREGRVVTNFGLLSRSGGENRLNVAISRARKAMHVISSIGPDDFRPGHVQNPGLALLREFLGFAQSQSLKRDVPTPDVTAAGYESDWSLKSRLLELDSNFSKEIPSSVMDLVTQDFEGNAIAVLTDDQRFFSASTAKAAVAYHPILLEGKGWKWEWRWSREGLKS